MFGGGVGGGKSYLGASIFINLAMKYNGLRFAVFRRNMTVLKRTTYQTFLKYCRQNNIIEGRDFHINKQDMVWEFIETKSQIWFMEGDHTRDPDFDKIKGMELTAAMADEVNEFIEDFFDTLTTRVGRENPPEYNIPAFIFMTCNPANNWIKARFYDIWLKGKLEAPYLFIQSLPEDNPYNPDEYIARLKQMPLQYRKRYLEGSWEYIDDKNSLVSLRVLDKSIRPIAEKKGTDRFAFADIAREGRDETVFCLVEGDMATDIFIPEIEISEEEPILMKVAEAFIDYCDKNQVGYENAGVDGVGLGAGVIDKCREKKFFVQTFKAGYAADKEIGIFEEQRVADYKDLRSQAYSEMVQEMDDGKFKIYEGIPFIENLKQDLLAHKVFYEDKITTVESKKIMKKRLGRSPDYSDALAGAHWLKDREENIINEDDVDIL